MNRKELNKQLEAQLKSLDPILRDPKKLRIAVLGFVMIYGIIAGRLVYLGFSDVQPSLALKTAQDSVAAARPDLVDRNGVILATDIKTASLFAEPYKITYVDDALDSLTGLDSRADKLRNLARYIIERSH